MDKSHVIYISKLDAAKRQLILAVKMFFYDSDVVGTHTLTCASFEILKDLAKKRNIKSIHDHVIDAVKPEFVKRVIKKIKAPANFFKHADKEPSEAVLEFNPKQTQLILFDAARLYRELTSEIEPIIAGYVAWYHMKNPESLSSGEAREAYIGGSSKFNLDNKREFFKILVDLDGQIFSKPVDL